MNKAFESFCRTHFIKKDGSIGKLTSNSPEAKRRKRQTFLADLNNKKNKKMRRVSELYETARKWREKEDNQVYLEKVKPIMEEAAALRDEIEVLQKKISKLSRGS